MAAKAARQLISISSKHTEFYHACSLYYDAISSNRYWWDKGAYNKITQAVNLFQDAISSTSSSKHMEEMMRAMQTQSMSEHYRCEDMKVVYDQTLANLSEPMCAMLCAEIRRDSNLEEKDDNSLEMVLCLETHAIKVLQSY